MMLRQFFMQLDSFLGGGILFHAVKGVLIILFVLLIGKSLKFLLNTIGRKLISKTRNDLDDKILGIVLDRLMSITAITAMYCGLLQLRTGLPERPTAVHALLEYSNGALFVLMALVLSAVAIRIADTFVRQGLQRVAQKGATNFDQELAPLINRVVNIVIIAVAFIVVLDHFNQNISTLLVSLGVGSLAVALAAQDTISNMIAGFVIMIDRPFRVGDRVKLPTNEEGDIFEIGVRSTKILDFDNNMLIVPNNELIKTKIINYTFPDPVVRVVVDVAVPYSTDAENVKRVLKKMAADHSSVLRTPAPEVFLIRFGDYALHFRLVCRVAHVGEQFATAEALRMQVIDVFKKAGIEFATQQQTITIAENEGRRNKGTVAKKR
ncbi:MAG: mechanosensitive ion channel family protein [Ignavibacteriales bacterium]|nr:mechanosensitive ion channel family protein [Ignavibacteriales bacterium]